MSTDLNLKRKNLDDVSDEDISSNKMQLKQDIKNSLDKELSMLLSSFNDQNSKDYVFNNENYEKFLYLMSTFSRLFENQPVNQIELLGISHVFEQCDEFTSFSLIRKLFKANKRNSYAHSLKAYETISKSNLYSGLIPIKSHSLLEECDAYGDYFVEGHIFKVANDDVYDIESFGSTDPLIINQIWVESLIKDYINNNQHILYYDKFAKRLHQDKYYLSEVSKYFIKIISKKNNFIPKHLLSSITLKVIKEEAIYKEETKENKNYRPITVYSTISVLFQRILLEFLINETVDKIESLQFAYRKLYDKELAAAAILQHIQKIQQDNLSYAVLSFDIKAAFLSVNHEKLKIKLEAKLKNKILAKFIDYFLKYSKTRIFIRGQKSDKYYSLEKGVPQGSPLGPWLFILYLDDIAKVIDYENAEMFLFADDLLLIIRSHEENLAKLITDYCYKISKWCFDNDFSLNQKKFKYFIHTKDPFNKHIISKNDLNHFITAYINEYIKSLKLTYLKLKVSSFNQI